MNGTVSHLGNFYSFFCPPTRAAVRAQATVENARSEEEGAEEAEQGAQ